MSTETDQPEELSPEEACRQARIAYYRQILRHQDQQVLKRLQKIPEDWNAIDPSSPIASISTEQKKRLSDLKRYKSWELKVESLYIYYLISIEDTVMALLQQQEVSRDQFTEAIEAMESLALEVSDHITDFKQLTISLAKRQVSDFYYFMNAYLKFNKITSHGFEKDFFRLKEILTTFIREQRATAFIVDEIVDFSRQVDTYYEKSSNTTGWKMKDALMKDFIDAEHEREKAALKSDFLSDPDPDENFTLSRLAKTVTRAWNFTRRIRKDFLFLRYYYNDIDGKLFRINFINESMYLKLVEGKLDQQVFDAFQQIRESFILMKNTFEWKGLRLFGPKKINYGEILEFLFRAAKLIEQYYLRSGRYDELRTIREDILYKLETEYFAVYPERRR